MAAHLSVVHPPPAQQRPRRLIRSAVRRVWPRDLVVRVEPGCPPGWRVGPPDFVGVGAQKAGTSWWHRLISEHPSVALRPDQAKELHYFDSFFDRPFTRADAARYHGFFPRPYGAKSGEWTPRYLTDFWAHEQLRMAAPEAGIIVLLRDPVDRYRSGLTHELNEGARRRPTLALEAMYRGLYHRQLTALLGHFPREQVLVLQYEECCRDPLPQLERTYEFLGFDDVHHRPASVRAQVNPTPSAKHDLPAQVRDQLVGLYEADVAALLTQFPEIDPSLWPHFRHLAELRPSRTPNR